MRIILASTYWPEYSGPAVRISRINSFLKENTVIISSKRQKIGLSINKKNYQSYFEITIEFRFFYLLDFLISFILFFLLPYKKKIHTFGSCAIIHALFLISNIRKDLKLIIELVNSDSSPIINYSKIGIKFSANKKNSLLLALNSSQTFSGYKRIIKPNPISNKIIECKIKENKKFPLKVDNEVIKLGYLSKFKYRKNQSFLIEVLNFLPKNYKLILAGPIDTNFDEAGRSNKIYLEKIYKLIKTNNLEDRVTLKQGFIDPVKFFYSIDHYLIPAFNEGFGTSIVEAICFGLPVTFNKCERSFLDCYKVCKNTMVGSDIKNPKLFAEDIQKLESRVNFKELKKSRSKIINLCSQDKINSLYKRILIEN